MNINFIIQSLLIITNDNYNSDELRMIYDYLLSIDNETLFSYHLKVSLRTYETDFHIYIDVIDRLIKIFEKIEDYEKCYKLKLKKDESQNTINKLKYN